MRDVAVMDTVGRINWCVRREHALRMVRRSQAVQHSVNKFGELTMIQLTEQGEPHPCRTHTAAGLLGEQRYTTFEMGKVNGFRRIFPEDAAVFQSATLDNGAKWIARTTVYRE